MNKIHKTMLFIVVTLASLCLMVTAYAGVEYVRDKNIIWVTDYPPAYPCTPKLIFQADQAGGWGKVEYNEAADTYIIRSDLYIGTDNLWSTYFQIGDNEYPRTIVEMHGNIIVHPDVPQFTDTEKYKTFISPKTTPGANALFVGCSANPDIRPAIRFAAGHGLALGFSDRRWPFAGELYVYNSAITSLPTETGRVVGLNGWLRLQGRTIRLVDSHISNMRHGIQGVMGGGWDHQVSGMIFENMGIGLLGYWDSRAMTKPLKNCSFLRCGIALSQPHTYLSLINCNFEQNDVNWDLKQIKQIFLHNCVVDGKPTEETINP